MRIVLLVLASVSVASAQPVSPEAACTYTECAIRLEPGFFGSAEIVQGASGQEAYVGSVGVLAGGLIDQVGTVPLALEHAQSARRNHVRSLFAALVGVVALSYSTALVGDEVDGLDIAALAGGIAASVAASVWALDAQREQARAVWEYNRAVVGE